MILTNQQIQRAINHTTGPGNTIPNAHRVKSWLWEFDGVDDIDYGRSFNQIAMYIFERYGIKTRLSERSVIGHDYLNGPCYQPESDSYITSLEESEAISSRNMAILSSQPGNEIKRKRGWRGRSHRS